MRDVPRHVLGQVADENLRPERARAQLRMGEIEIVDPLRDMVGELVRQREADAERRAVVADDVDAGDLRLLAAILGEGRRKSAARRVRRPNRAVALVEPFGLHADPCRRFGLPPSRPMRNIFIESVSVSSPSSATFLCIASRVEPSRDG
jgi:hypothetical protein